MSNNPDAFTVPTPLFPESIDMDMPDLGDFIVPDYIHDAFDNATNNITNSDSNMVGMEMIAQDPLAVQPEIQPFHTEFGTDMCFDFDFDINDVGNLNAVDGAILTLSPGPLVDGHGTVYTTDRNTLYDDPTPANDGVSLLLQAPLDPPTAGTMSFDDRNWACINDLSLINSMFPDLSIPPIPMPAVNPFVPAFADPIDQTAGLFDPRGFNDLYDVSPPQGIADPMQVDLTQAAPELMFSEAELAELFAPIPALPSYLPTETPAQEQPNIPPLDPIIDEDEDEDISSPLSTMSSGALEKLRKPMQPGTFELQKLDPKKPWIGKNYTSEGKSVRSQKINNFNAEIVYNKPEAQLPPLGKSWTSSKGTKFEYTEQGELMASTSSTEQMRQFIYEHPRTKNCKLRLWVQVSPADSAKRYPCEDSSSCRFADCPMQKLGYKGTITTGHLRVAFDEKWCKHGEESDPFVVAGYVHLYCLERFLDLPEICRLDHLKVKVDDRELAKEPNGKWAAALGSKEPKISQIVREFIAAAESGPAGFAESYPFYPIHDSAMNRFPKSHVDTLNHAVQEARHLRSNREGGSKHSASNLASTLGDLEVFLEHKGNKSKVHMRMLEAAEEKEGKKRKRDGEDSGKGKKVRTDDA